MGAVFIRDSFFFFFPPLVFGGKILSIFFFFCHISKRSSFAQFERQKRKDALLHIFAGRYGMPSTKRGMVQGGSSRCICFTL